MGQTSDSVVFSSIYNSATIHDVSARFSCNKQLKKLLIIIIILYLCNKSIKQINGEGSIEKDMPCVRVKEKRDMNYGLTNISAKRKID